MNTSRQLIFIGLGAVLAWSHAFAVAEVSDAAPAIASPSAPVKPKASASSEPQRSSEQAALPSDYQLSAVKLSLTLPTRATAATAFSPVRVVVATLTPEPIATLAPPPRLAPLSAVTDRPTKLGQLSWVSQLVAYGQPHALAPTKPIAGAIAQTKPAPAQPSVAQLSAPQTPGSVNAPLTPFPPGERPAAPVVPPIVTPTPAPPSDAPQFPNFDPNAPAPDYLNPAPNPLSFPTKPEEVKLVGLQPLSLKQAQELALRNNRTVEVAKLQLERSQAVLREAQAALFPTLSTQLDLNRTRNASGEISARLTELSNQAQVGNPFFNPQDADSSDPIRTSISGTISLSYNVFTSGQRSARIRAAELQVRVNELNLGTEQAKLDVATDYYSLQDADQQVLINQAAVRNSEQSLRDTVAQERAGLGTRFDVLRAQVQLANAQQQLVNSIAAQRVRRRQLAQRLSLAEAIDLYAADPVQPAGTWKLSLEESVVLAYKNRSDLETQLLQREIADQNRKVALSALGPTVSVSAQYNLLDIFELPVRTADGYTFSAQARWNLFDGGQARAQARQAEKDQQIAEVRFADAKNQIRLAVEQSYATLQSNLANIETATQAENQAGQSLYLARLRFQAGVGTQSDVINAETDLTRAQGNRISAIIGYNRSLAELQRAISNVPGAISTR